MPINKRRDLFLNSLQLDFVETNDPQVATTKYRNKVLYLVRDGVANPGWRQQVANGVSASTPMSVRVAGVKYETGRATMSSWRPSYNSFDRKVKTFWTQDFIFGFGSWPSFYTLDLTKATNQALTRLHRSIREGAYQISGPLFLGELRQSLAMIRKPLSAIQSTVRSYLTDLRTRRDRYGRRGTPAQRQRALSSILSDTYLEYSMGWSPLISDAKDAATTFARIAHEIRRTQVRGFGSMSEGFVETRSSGTTPAGIPFRSREREGADGKVIYRAGLSAQVDYASGSLQRFIDLSGFQWQNFIPTIWNLLPWSFLLDYFGNIGDVIEAGCTDVSKVQWVQKNEIHNCFRDLYLFPDTQLFRTNLNNIALDGSLGSLKSFNRFITRTASGIEYPKLSFELPGQAGQFANMAALIISGKRMQPYSPG